MNTAFELSLFGAQLDARDYDIGHSISQDELHDAVAWLNGD